MFEGTSPRTPVLARLLLKWLEEDREDGSVVNIHNCVCFTLSTALNRTQLLDPDSTRQQTPPPPSHSRSPRGSHGVQARHGAQHFRQGPNQIGVLRQIHAAHAIQVVPQLLVVGDVAVKVLASQVAARVRGVGVWFRGRLEYEALRIR